MKSAYIVFVFYILAVCSCKKASSGNSSGGSTDTAKSSSVFIKGADISWLTQMEAANIKFYDTNGTQKDCMQILKDLGMNAIRLRAWVNPSDGWCNTADVLNKALRAKALGLKIMIDFHYSDVWADPGHQTKPVAWDSLAFAALDSTLYDYTFHVMDTLKANGIIPQWAQVGNETNDGMLWEDGRASTNFRNFASLVNSGYNAIKAVSDSTKVIVHISNGFDNSLFRWVFDSLKVYNAKWDIIGMSLYPTTANYGTLDAQCLTNINTMISRYNTPVMIVEVGMEADQPQTTRDFLTDIITKVNGVANGQGLGVFYWEPEAYNWQSYGLGAFDTTGKPTIALDAFGNN